MRNATCCLLVMLFGSWSSSLGQNAPKLTTPQIVATFQRLNLTHDIHLTTIYTPTNWGTFRVSLLMTLNVENGNDGVLYGDVFSENGGGKLVEPSLSIRT